jgi:hypothetical protein
MGMTWQPLSVRVGQRRSDGPYEGIPEHLRYSIGEWLFNRLRSFDGVSTRPRIATVASAIRVSLVGSVAALDQILDAIEQNDDLYLDCIDATLNIGAGVDATSLERDLLVGGSVWTVREDRLGLERRVDEATSTAYTALIADQDSISEELRQAWAAAFGRNPDPSDAWDHAIKAVEEVLIPIVVPRVLKANLGTVAGEIKAHPDLWSFGLAGDGNRNNGETLEGLLRHIWPNPDRHGGATKRTPTPPEAVAVVRVAIFIVGLCKGKLQRVP